MSVVAGRLADRFGHRTVIVPGALLMAAGGAWMWSAATSEPRIWTLWVPVVVVYGTGVGLGHAACQAAALATVGEDRLGIGGAMNRIFMEIGGTISIAVVIALFVRYDDPVNGLRASMLLLVIVSAISVPIAASLPQPRPRLANDAAHRSRPRQPPAGQGKFLHHLACDVIIWLTFRLSSSGGSDTQQRSNSLVLDPDREVFPFPFVRLVDAFVSFDTRLSGADHSAVLRSVLADDYDVVLPSPDEKESGGELFSAVRGADLVVVEQDVLYISTAKYVRWERFRDTVAELLEHVTRGAGNRIRLGPLPRRDTAPVIDRTPGLVRVREPAGRHPRHRP